MLLYFFCLQFALFCSGLLVFLTVAFAQPYTSKVANINEALLLLDLLLISALYLNTNSLVLERVRPIALTLLLIPFVVGITYLVCKVATHIW